MVNILYENLHEMLYYKDFHFLLWRTIRRGGYMKVHKKAILQKLSLFVVAYYSPWRLYKKISEIIFFITTITLIISITGCAEHSKKFIRSAKVSTPLVKLAPYQYPKFSDDLNYQKLEMALLESINYFSRVPNTRTYSYGNEKFTALHIKQSLQVFLLFIRKKPTAGELQKFINANYLVYKSVGGKKTSKVLFTGYYEPSLKGSYIKDDRFKYPIYGKPDDLVSINLSLFSDRFKGEKNLMARYTGDNKDTIIPYFSRKELTDNNHLKTVSKPIVWVDDPVDLFFLEIQGSGKISLQNGEVINVHYHTKNGRPYKSIGRYLIENKKIKKEDISMQSIRAYIKENPDEMDDIFNYNQSYVFFKTEESGPLGCLGVVVTEGRSIATDRRIFPQGALAFIATKKPVVDGYNNITEWENFNRFVFNQDTGGAIIGPGRTDIFWGNGEYAKIAAGHMQHLGDLYFLIKKK